MAKNFPLFSVFCCIFLCVLVIFPGSGTAQTAFVNFNTAGQYTANFNPWNDNGGVNGGNYSFEENTTDGVGGSGGVAVYQNNDMTATYKGGSWNLSTNGATILVSVLVYTDGQSYRATRCSLGVINSDHQRPQLQSGRRL